MRTLAFAFVSILLSVAAQFCLKVGMSRREVNGSLVEPSLLTTISTSLTNGYVLAGLLLYALGALVWLMVLSKWEVSKAYPLVGLGFALTAIVGLTVGEQVSAFRAAGVALICVGVVLVARS